jgi:hypothetical protein
MVPRRFAFSAVSGILILTAVAPAVLAAPPSPSKGGPKTPPSSATTTTTMAPTTTTTAPPPPPPPPPSSPPPASPPPNRTPVSCSAPDAKHDVAPPMGSTSKYQAGPGGSADITRTAQAELKVAGVTPSPGWTHIVFTATGQNVRVKYTDGANPRHYVRQVVSLNNSGTEIHVRLTTCQ